MLSLQVSDSSFYRMCGCIGLDNHATDFAPVPLPPFTEPGLSLLPVMPSAMSPWFLAVVLTPSVADGGGGGRQSSASGAAPHVRHLLRLAFVHTPDSSSQLSSWWWAPLSSPLFHFAPSGLRPILQFRPTLPHLSFLPRDRDSRCS